jgi:hypothetical protein
VQRPCRSSPYLHRMPHVRMGRSDLDLAVPCAIHLGARFRLAYDPRISVAGACAHVACVRLLLPVPVLLSMAVVLSMPVPVRARVRVPVSASVRPVQVPTPVSVL